MVLRNPKLELSIEFQNFHTVIRVNGANNIEMRISFACVFSLYVLSYELANLSLKSGNSISFYHKQYL